MSYSEKEYDAFADSMKTKYPAMFSKPYGGFAVGTGWWTIIERLCANIQSHIDHKNSTREHLLKANPYGHKVPDAVEQVTVDQIKEKFGGLRFYYTGGDDYISGLVSMAESWAANSCEECGKPGTRRSGGWIRTLCDEHEAERQSKMKERFGETTM